MSVLVKFMQSGTFHTGVSQSIDLDKISRFQISHQRTTCELLAITPENSRPNIPYMIARRDNEYQLKDIVKDLRQLQQEHKDIIYDITDTEAHLVNKT
jgi:hypothetical protein